MDSLYILIPVTVVLLVIAVAAYLWSVNSGQFDDLDKAAHGILFEDEDTGGPHRAVPQHADTTRASPREGE